MDSLWTSKLRYGLQLWATLRVEDTDLKKTLVTKVQKAKNEDNYPVKIEVRMADENKMRTRRVTSGRAVETGRKSKVKKIKKIESDEVNKGKYHSLRKPGLKSF